MLTSILRSLAAACLTLSLPACSPGKSYAAAPTPLPMTCLDAPGVTWVDADIAEDHSVLDGWCSTVGAPVVAPAPSTPEGDVRRLVVISWNVHVGAGRIPDLVKAIRAEAGTDAGIVLLLQEMFRVGPAVPEWSARLFKLPGRIAPRRGTPEVATLARELGMAVAYVPSMRNGDSLVAAEREDRGSAILSTEPLSDITAIELPMLKQRRIVVMATVRPRGARVPPLRVMTTHFDTLGPRGTQATALAGYIASLPAEPPLVMGGDLNALWGTRDQTVRTLSRVMAMERCGDRSTHLFGRFDYIFSTLGNRAARSCETLDDKHASDHRPLRLTLTY